MYAALEVRPEFALAHRLGLIGRHMCCMTVWGRLLCNLLHYQSHCKSKLRPGKAKDWV